MGKEYMLEALLGNISDHMAAHIIDLATRYGYSSKSASFNVAYFWSLAAKDLQWLKIHGDWKMDLFYEMYKKIEPEDLQLGPALFKKVQRGLCGIYKKRLQDMVLDALTY